MLYVLRTARTGMHLLRTGELVTDLTALTPLYGPDIADLRQRKQTGERATLTTEELEPWKLELERAVRDLEIAVSTSMLPVEPPPAAVAALDDWLRDLRKVKLVSPSEPSGERTKMTHGVRGREGGSGSVRLAHLTQARWTRGWLLRWRA